MRRVFWCLVCQMCHIIAFNTPAMDALIKAKLHGLNSQNFVCLLKLFATKVIFCIPFEISIWQHPIPKQDSFTTLLMF